MRPQRCPSDASHRHIKRNQRTKRQNPLRTTYQTTIAKDHPHRSNQGQPANHPQWSVLRIWLLVATDTVVTTVEWAELMLHPAATKQAAQDKLNIVVGTNGIMQELVIAKLPYLQVIVKEDFRLLPRVALSLSTTINWSIPRVSQPEQSLS